MGDVLVPEMNCRSAKTSSQELSEEQWLTEALELAGPSAEKFSACLACWESLLKPAPELGAPSSDGLAAFADAIERAGFGTSEWFAALDRITEINDMTPFSQNPEPFLARASDVGSHTFAVPGSDNCLRQREREARKVSNPCAEVVSRDNDGGSGRVDGASSNTVFAPPAESRRVSSSPSQSRLPCRTVSRPPLRPSSRSSSRAASPCPQASCQAESSEAKLKLYQRLYVDVVEQPLGRC